MAENSQVLGQEATVEADGKSWKLRFDGDVKKGFEEWLTDRAFAKLEARRNKVRDYADQLERLNEAAAAGVFEWGGALQNRSMSTEAGAAILVKLLAARHHPTATIEEVDAAISANLEGFSAAIQRLLYARPNGQAPTGTTNPPAPEKA